MNASNEKPKLQVGGTLIPRKHLFITRRDLEDELLETLAQGEYCNLLSSRQVGKSSVMMQAAVRLRERGIRVVSIDVAGDLGTPATAAEWYRAFLLTVVRALAIDLNVDAWWEGQSGTPNQRLAEFFRTVLFAGHAAPVVIFVDEIDATLKLPYTDDFFTAIRTMYNQRGAEPAYEKTAFCLIGVATPNELVKDRRTTTYNVGKTLSVRDFDPARDDLSALVAALADDGQAGKGLLQQVLHWTGGHPYLTLWLCREIQSRKLRSPADVDALAGETFSSFLKVEEEPHFQQITRFLGQRVTDQLAAYRLYDRLLRGRTVRDMGGQTHIELKLSGIVKRDDRGNLAVRNRIYEKVFSREWVRQSRPQRTVRSLRQFALAATLLLLVGGGWFGYDRLVREPVRQNRILAEGLVEGYLVAEIGAVPEFIDRMRPYRQWTDPVLQTYLESDRPKRLRASLALLEVDREQCDYLSKQLLEADMAGDGPVIADALARYAATDARSLTARLATGDAAEFHALFPALAEDAGQARKSLCEAIEFLSHAIGDARLAQVARSARVSDPAETDDRRSPGNSETADQSDGPVERPADASGRPLVGGGGSVGRPATAPVGRPATAPVERPATALHTALHQRRAIVAIAALRLGDVGPVLPLLELGPEPDTRSYLIRDLAGRFGELEPLVAILRNDALTPAARSALLLGLGHFASEKIPAATVELAQKLFETDNDPGIHGAAFWALRQWKQPVPKLAQTTAHPTDRGWYVNSLGMTLIRVPAGSFWRGDDESRFPWEAPRHEVQLTNGFYLGDCEVTVAQFLAFVNDPDCPETDKPVGWIDRWNEYGKQRSPTDDCPIQSVSWEDAARFCNWLSRREKRTEVYKRTGGKRKVKDDVLNREAEIEVWKTDLKANGYRLPTEAQWEYACRAASQTQYGFGDDSTLLNDNAHYDFDGKQERTLPVASKLPNGWGLFDMQGNVWEWCQDWYNEDEYEQFSGKRASDPRGPETALYRVVRGGGWFSTGENCRPAYRCRILPERRLINLGFRVARGLSSE